jgi:hypothetical protein
VDIKDALLKEHSRSQAIFIHTFIGADRNRFAMLMKLFFGQEYRVTQRAAWVLSLCVEKHPELLKPWLRKMVLNLSRPDLHDAVKRNTLRILQSTRIPKNLQGTAVDLCFRFLKDENEPIAVQVFSISVLHNVCLEEPLLQNELRLVIESKLPYASAGFKSRGRKVLTALSGFGSPVKQKAAKSGKLSSYLPAQT